MNKIKARFIFSKRVWISLGLGWLSLAICMSPLIDLGQAGALIVCSAIVAEVLNEKRHRLFLDQVLPGNTQSHIFREVAVAGEDRKDIEITPSQFCSAQSTVNTSSWPLYHLAIPEEFYKDGDARLWDLNRTMKRAERRVEYAIVTNAIIGTVLWAFG